MQYVYLPVNQFVQYICWFTYLLNMLLRQKRSKLMVITHLQERSDVVFLSGQGIPAISSFSFRLFSVIVSTWYSLLLTCSKKFYRCWFCFVQCFAVRIPF